MRSDIASLLFFFLILLPFWTTAHALPRNIENAHKSDLHSRTSQAPSISLDRRGAKHLGQGWWMYYDTLTSLIPWQIAAAGIENFFQSISEKANGEWLSRDPQNYLEITKGDLKLEFYSELLPINWSFIADFANTMLHALELGFVSMFDMRIVAPNGMAVYIHLRVRQALAATAA